MNALQNSQALLRNSTYEGTPYAYNTNFRGAEKDRYGA